MREQISPEKYIQLFPKEKKEKALELALDIRKFEIDLYWKRATYFWTFIAASLAAFGIIQASKNIALTDKTDLSVIISCLGMVFSVGWLCVNRGSKHWQENWENHVNMLEDDIYGPIFKITLKREPPVGFKEKLQHYINGPSEISTSKINQIISLYVCILWGCLLIKSLPPFDSNALFSPLYCFMVILTLITCILFFTKLGATYKGSYTHRAEKMTSIIGMQSTKFEDRK